MTGETASPQEALGKAAAEWNRITDKHGREKQQELYNAFMDAYYDK